ncbi:hypothetical protein GCM10027511_33150 [Hymenobacter humi]
MKEFHLKSWLAGILLTIALLHVVLFFTLVKTADRTIFNFYTLVGGFISAAGIILTFIQLKSVREQAESIKQSVSRYNNILTLVEVSGLYNLLTEARAYIINREFKTGHQRLSTLKPTISTLLNRISRQNIKIEQQEGEPSLNNLIFDFRQDVHNLDVSILNNDNFESIDFTIVLKHTDDLLNYFSNLTENLKSLDNES